LSEYNLFGPTQKKEKLGFFGFALGLVIYFVTLILLNVIPYGNIVIALFYAPFTIPFQAVMSFIYPLIWSVPFIFIQRTKTTM
jgi:hypothetical protein